VGEALVEAVADTEDGEVEVEIRPEEITLHLGEGPQSSARNRLPGTVKEILPYENYHHVIIDCRDFPLKVAVTAQSIEQLGLRPGVEVFTFFKATAVKVLQPNQLGGDAHGR
ncbi:MAG: molybdopterin-binding protein, partial [Candidatus Bipolaricaulia bacterium]